MVIEQENKVLVSIIVPFYNVEEYIGKTLLSIENQTFFNFEAILIDDGSTDKSHQVVENYISKCRFKNVLIRQENSGVSAARNNGLKHASGEYVVFVDADDVLSSFYISRMYEHLSLNNAELTICGFQTFEDDDKLKFNSRPSQQEAQILDSLDIMHKTLLCTLKISAWSLMIRRELLDIHNIRFAEGYKYDEDIHFIWRVLAHVDNIVFDPTPLYYYRMRSGSAMAKFNESRLDGMYLMQDIEEYLQRNCEYFFREFNKFGVARWVWALMWQAACALPYKQFKDVCRRMQAFEMMARLKKFPDSRVSISAQLFAYSKYAFYCVARIAARLKGVDRF